MAQESLLSTARDRKRTPLRDRRHQTTGVCASREHPILRSEAGLQEIALVRSWLGRVCLRISLDHVLAVLKPIVKAAVYQHAGHIHAVEDENAIAPDADRLSHLVQCPPGNGFHDSVNQVGGESSQPPVSFHILRCGRKRGVHDPPFSKSGTGTIFPIFLRHIDPSADIFA